MSATISKVVYLLFTMFVFCYANQINSKTLFNNLSESNKILASLDSSQNLKIEERGFDSDDNITISFDGESINLKISNANLNSNGIEGISASLENMLNIPINSIKGNQIIINSGGGDDILTIDFGDNRTPFTKEIIFNGEGQRRLAPYGDGIVLLCSEKVEMVSHTFINKNDGSILVSGNAPIIYTGLEPITQSITATNISLNFAGGAQTITISDDGTINNNMSTVQSTDAELVNFVNPTDLLTVNSSNVAGEDIINLDGLDNMFAASLDISGDSDGKININTPIIFAPNKSFSISGQTISAPNITSNITTSGNGTITLTASKNIEFITGSSLTTSNGNISLSGNNSKTSTGSFVGVNFEGAFIRSNGTGNISIVGVGGDIGNLNHGVGIQSNTTISSTATGASAGTITIEGTGGSGGYSNCGVYVSGPSTKVSGVDGSVEITGIGGSGTNDLNYGVRIANSAEVELTGSGEVLVDATGGGSGVTGTNHGLLVYGSVEVVSGDLSISGTGGVGNSDGVFLNAGQLLTTSGNIDITGIGNGTQSDLRLSLSSDKIGGSGASGNITINANTINLNSGSIESTGMLFFLPRTASTTIGIGGGAGTLNLTDTELSYLTDGFFDIVIGDGSSGDLDINSALFTDRINFSTGGAMHDGSGVDITAPSIALFGDTAPGQSPGVLSISGDLTFAEGSSYSAEFGGTSPGVASNNHDQISVTGSVTISNNIALTTNSFGGYTPSGSEEYIIISNDESDAVIGTFSGLAEGATISNDFLSSSHSANISYIGGDGNDVIIAVSSEPVPVELSSFVASAFNNTVKLCWSTMTEINNYGFEVQRSDVSNQMSEKEWKEIGFIEGHGNSNSPKYYEFIDTSPKGIRTETQLNSNIVKYRLKQIDTDSGFKYSDVVEIEINSVKEFKLFQNHPNPFNPTTTISYSLPENGKVQIVIFDMLGNQVSTLVNEQKQTGTYKVEFDASHLASGVYLYKMESKSFSETKKLLLLK